MWINSACPRAAVRAKPAPSPWAALCWCSMGRQRLASKCGLREDGTSGNHTLGRTAGPKGRSNISYTTKMERFHSWASSSFQSFGGALWPKRESPTQELEWLEAPLLHRKRALTRCCTADQLEEQECSGGTHFQTMTLPGQRTLMNVWAGLDMFYCKWPLCHCCTCINWQVLQEGSWHFQSHQLPKASRPASQQFGMWSLCLQQQLPDHTILRSLGLCCGTVVSFLPT